MDDKTIWAIGLTNVVWVYTAGSWKKVIGSYKQIAVGYDKRVYGLNAFGKLYTRMGIVGSWA